MVRTASAAPSFTVVRDAINTLDDPSGSTMLSILKFLVTTHGVKNDSGQLKALLSRFVDDGSLVVNRRRYKVATASQVKRKRVKKGKPTKSGTRVAVKTSLKETVKANDNAAVLRTAKTRTRKAKTTTTAPSENTLAGDATTKPTTTTTTATTTASSAHARLETDTISSNACAALLGSTARLPVVQIVHLYRFLVDARFTAVAAMACDAAGDAFDAVISDGVYQLKCLLSTSLNGDVKRGFVRCFDVIRIVKYALRFDELRIASGPFVVIEELEVVGRDEIDEGAVRLLVRDAEGHVAVVTKPTALKRIRTGEVDSAGIDEEELEDRPLVGDRAYYIAMGDNQTPVGRQWRAYGVAAPDDLVIKANQPTIAQVIGSLNRNVALPEYVIGRVLRKTNLVHYAKSGTRDRYPFNFTLTLADQMSTCNVVVWTSCCHRYFHSIQLGDVVAVSGYRLQSNSQRRAQVASSSGAHDGVVGDEANPRWRQGSVSRAQAQLSAPLVELAVNPTNPEGRIRVLPVQQIFAPPPPIILNMVNADVLSTVTAFAEIDLCGVITFVGRRQVERVRNDSHQVHEHRWLLVRDHTRNEPISVKWYCNGRDDVLSSFAVGQRVGLTDLKVMKLNSLRGDVAPLVFCKSTFCSQRLDVERLERMSSAQTAIGEILTWADTLEPLGWAAPKPRASNNNVFLRTPVDCALQSVVDLFDARLVLLTELVNIAQSLLVNEVVDVLVQARIESLAAETASDSVAPRHARDPGTPFFDVSITLVSLNGDTRETLLIPDGVYASGDARDEAKASEFQAFLARNTKLTLAEMMQLMSNSAQTTVPSELWSRPVVVHVSLCRELRAVSAVVVGVYETSTPLIDRRE